MAKYPWYKISCGRLKRVKRSKFGNEYFGEIFFPATYEMPRGWRLAFEDLLLADLDAEIKKSKLKDFRVEQIKEKFGELRFYYYGGNDNTDKIVDAYSVLSRHICLYCGKPDVPIQGRAWIFPACKHCCETSKLKYEDNDDSKMADEYTVRRFSASGSEDITYDISEYATKVRRKYEKRMGGK